LTFESDERVKGTVQEDKKVKWQGRPDLEELPQGEKDEKDE
jgi:hypothetical protein